MNISKKLITKGYFPKELPFIFNSTTLSRMAEDTTININSYKPNFSKSLKYNIPKTKNFTRTIHIPNPLQYMKISNEIESNWDEIKNMLDISQNSLTKPVLDPEEKSAFVYENSYDDLLEKKANLSCSKKYLLYTDISNFYRSIYTHSIPWAIHGKSFAKQNRSDKYYGNILDKCVRNMQDQQTMGLPTGVDASMIISELLLTSIDIELNEKIKGLNYVRYVDDYYFYFDELSEAENALTILSYILKEYELELNDRKTHISELPLSLEPLWQQDLKSFRIRSTDKEQRNDIRHFFSLSFDYYHKHKNSSVLFYSISHISLIKIKNSNWSLYESFLLQSMFSDTSLIPIIGKLLITYKGLSYDLDMKKIELTIKRIIISNSKNGNNYAISWALWLISELNINMKLEDGIINNISDPISILMVLFVSNNGNLTCTIPKTDWQRYMKSEELYNEHWILSYEALQRSWLNNRVGSDYVSKDPFFNKLKELECSFIDDRIHIEPLPEESLLEEQNLDVDFDPFEFFYDR